MFPQSCRLPNNFSHHSFSLVFFVAFVTHARVSVTYQWRHLIDTICWEADQAASCCFVVCWLVCVSFWFCLVRVFVSIFISFLFKWMEAVHQCCGAAGAFVLNWAMWRDVIGWSQTSQRTIKRLALTIKNSQQMALLIKWRHATVIRHSKPILNCSCS